MHWYLDVLKKYAVFSGRARRQEFWMYTLFNIIAIIILAIIDAVIGSTPVIVAIYYVAIILPTLGVGARRLHDTGRSGWWLLFGIVPLVGEITLFVLMCLEGDRGQNAHGQDPKPGYAPAH
ncbi:MULTISPECIES: DUF805 domain-containing protein [unclassified Streptomyces]|uniref:DUF805 domain-containing protein n=1 Tax=unclassified Streptomyces TaxID=2593676 RepID=UPI0036E2D647